MFLLVRLQKFETPERKTIKVLFSLIYICMPTAVHLSNDLLI
jgi:hypothetical protein